jgi:hypothetical protein
MVATPTLVTYFIPINTLARLPSLRYILPLVSHPIADISEKREIPC